MHYNRIDRNKQFKTIFLLNFPLYSIFMLCQSNIHIAAPTGWALHEKRYKYYSMGSGW